MLGDALNMRHPVTGGTCAGLTLVLLSSAAHTATLLLAGMTVALTDVEILAKLFADVPSFSKHTVRHRS